MIPLPVALALTGQVAISSATYLVAKYALNTFDPWEVLVLRLLGAAPLFGAVLLSMPAPRLPALRQLPFLALLALLGIGFNQGFFLAGLRWSTPTHAGLLYALTPLLVFAMAAAARLERVTAPKVIGIGIALGGVSLVLLEKGQPGGSTLAGDALILVGVLSWAAFTLLGRSRAAALGPIRMTCWSMLVGAVLCAPLAPLALQPRAFGSASLEAWAAMTFLVVLTSFVSYLLWYFALARAEASKVAVWSNLQPVLTAALSWLFLGTPITWAFALGGTLVLAGVVLTQRG